MNLELLLLALVPLAIFVFVEWKYGQQAGIYAALSCMAAVVVYWYFRTGKVDETLAIEALLLLVLGAISLKLKDSRFFKFQPTIVAIVFVLYIGYFQFIGDPFIGRMMRLMAELAPEQIQQFQAMPRFEICISHSSMATGLGIGFHGALVAWGALKLSSFGWLLTRLALYPILIVISLYNAACMMG